MAPQSLPVFAGLELHVEGPTDSAVGAPLSVSCLFRRPRNLTANTSRGGGVATAQSTRSHFSQPCAQVPGEIKSRAWPRDASVVGVLVSLCLRIAVFVRPFLFVCVRAWRSFGFSSLALPQAGSCFGHGS